MNDRAIKFKKSTNSSIITTRHVLNKTEFCMTYLDPSTSLADLIHAPCINNITGKPVKCLKIGNGSQEYSELKSIIILDNADFIIVDKDGYIIDYITNSSPTDVATIAT